MSTHITSVTFSFFLQSMGSRTWRIWASKSTFQSNATCATWDLRRLQRRRRQRSYRQLVLFVILSCDYVRNYRWDTSEISTVACILASHISKLVAEDEHIRYAHQFYSSFIYYTQISERDKDDKFIWFPTASPYTILPHSALWLLFENVVGRLHGRVHLYHFSLASCLMLVVQLI
jgi:hypothetical protein